MRAFFRNLGLTESYFALFRFVVPQSLFYLSPIYNPAPSSQYSRLNVDEGQHRVRYLLLLSYFSRSLMLPCTLLIKERHHSSFHACFYQHTIGRYYRSGLTGEGYSLNSFEQIRNNIKQESLQRSHLPRRNSDHNLSLSYLRNNTILERAVLEEMKIVRQRKNRIVVKFLRPRDCSSTDPLSCLYGTSGLR